MGFVVSCLRKVQRKSLLCLLCLWACLLRRLRLLWLVPVVPVVPVASVVPAVPAVPAVPVVPVVPVVPRRRAWFNCCACIWYEFYFYSPPPIWEECGGEKLYVTTAVNHILSGKACAISRDSHCTGLLHYACLQGLRHVEVESSERKTIPARYHICQPFIIDLGLATTSKSRFPHRAPSEHSLRESVGCEPPPVRRDHSQHSS